MSSTASKNNPVKELKRDPFDYPPSADLPLDVQKVIREHRILFSKLLGELRRMYGSNRYVSLAAQDLEAAESSVTKAAHFYGRNKIG